MRSAFAFGIVVLLAGCGGSGNPNVKSGPMPENGTFTGVYFSPQYGEMHMVQNGNAVVGKYKKDERGGKIQGEVDGDLMRFEWIEYKAMVSNRPQETRGHGYFKYMVDASNGDHLLKGRWGLADDDYGGGEWTAYKSKKGEPDLEHFGGEMPGDNKTSGGDDNGSGSDTGNSSSSGGGNEGDDEF